MATVTSGLASPTAVPARRRKAGLAGTLRSELTKIRSVRSTYVSLVLMVLASVVWSVAFNAGTAAHWSHMSAQARSGIDPTQSSVLGLALLGQLVIVVLGALTITSEYSTGMIRTSLSSMPRRGTLFAAKGVVFGAVALVTGVVTSFLAFFVGQAILSSQHVNTTLGHSGVLREVIGGGLFLAVTGLMSFGIGAMLRHSAGAIASGIGLMFVLMILTNFLPSPPSGWFGQADIDKWIPFFAGAHIWQNQLIGINPFSVWVGFGVFCAYAAAAIIGGFVMFVRRDA